MNTRLLGVAVAVVAIVVIAAVAVFATSGDDDGDSDSAAASPTPAASPTATAAPEATASPTATLGTAPAATETPEEGPEGLARGLELIEAPAGLLEFVTDGPYVVPGDAIGAFFLNVETQEIEGWYALIDGTQFVGFSGEGRFTLWSRKNQVLSGGTEYPAGLYLADRETRKLYRWEGEAEPAFEKTDSDKEIAARGDLVLFRFPEEDKGSWFSLLNVDTGEVESAFEAKASWAYIARDASRVALIGEDVFVAEVASGEVERVGEDATEDLTGPADVFEPGKWSGVELVEAEDGESFVFTANDSPDGSEAVWQRYTWDGKLLAKGEGAKAYVSPDGELAAVTEAIASADNATYYTVGAYNTADASPVFRVVGADERFPWPEHDRWLADGSGFVVQVPGNVARLALREGSLEDLPGVPSPDSPEVFASERVDSLALVDAKGNTTFSLTFQGGVRDFVDPWGDTGDEVRMLIPHGGHDGPPVTATIVEPYVEQAPFEDEAPIQLSDVAVGFGLLDLLNEPAGDRVVGQVMEPYRVVVKELRMVCSGNGFSDPKTCPSSDSTLPYEFMALVRGAELSPETAMTSYWARVRTPEGQEGWILLQANAQGI